MRTEDEVPEGGKPEGVLPDEAARLQSRRAMLRIGALGTAAVITVRPGMAQAAVSGLTCSIPVPDAANSGKWIKKNGDLVKANMKDSYPPPSSPLAGEDVKNSLKYGTDYPGYSSEASDAYNEYIKKLTIGKQGYTCYSSLQSPNRQ